jgi:hypothetical protein
MREGTGAYVELVTTKATMGSCDDQEVIGTTRSEV